MTDSKRIIFMPDVKLYLLQFALLGNTNVLPTNKKLHNQHKPFILGAFSVLDEA